LENHQTFHFSYTIDMELLTWFITRVNELDNMEIEILHQRGAFLLPPRALCDELVEAYFKWVAPVVPVINRSRFMRQYRDPKNPPSLLLLQAILLAGSRVCSNPQLMDSSGSTTPAAMTFYKSYYRSSPATHGMVLGRARRYVVETSFE